MFGLDTLAEKAAVTLRERDLRVVFAESCTAGLISATIGLVPGISGYLCGSAVVYREQTKVAWLGVHQTTLDSHSAVSEQATSEIAQGVLINTPEADVSLGITGHFGPNAPENDGVVFVAIYERYGEELREILARRLQLESQSRPDRQREAAALALQLLTETLSDRAQL